MTPQIFKEFAECLTEMELFAHLVLVPHVQAAQLEPEIFTPVRTRAPINFTPFYPLGKNVARHPSFKIGCPELRLVIKNPPANAGDSRDANSIPGLGRFPGEGKGNPLQYSCLGKPMDRAGGPQTMGSLRVRRD